jgi:LysR family transcriptional regulator, glycine cleavage system transcriptional activator
MPLTLPPLNSLRAFEAAARTGSFVAAAEELGVSPAAISQHIRKLEDYFGKDMFVRMNNRVVLTDAGHAILLGTAEALEQISEVTLDMTSDRSRSWLVISAIESVAEKWLLPRLIDYARAKPDFRFDLRVEPDPIDFARHNIDLRLCYGTGHYPDHHTQVLLKDSVQPMCSPGYLARHPELTVGGMAAVQGSDLLTTSWGPSFGSNPSWPTWFHKAGLEMPELGGFQVGRSSLALDLARAGVGVALAQRMLGAEDLADGRLTALSPTTMDLGHPYCLVHPHGKARKRSLVALLDWLIRSVKPGGFGFGSG